ncbi:MFS transporter [Candidatus Woesearchaeota archaeon]|nr:MFS transporter [Candidatus Woesearchaeota archaeon]
MNNLLKQRLKSNIWKFYLFEIFGGMFFAVPIIVLFWMENGLSLTQIMILQSIFSVFLILFEIPTGYFADIYGRKKSMLISGAGIFFGMLTYSLGDNFSEFLAAEFLFAIGLSFYSGTSSAFIYDTLKDLKQENKYKKIWGNAKFYGLLALAVSNVIGGFIGKIDLRLALFMSLPFMFSLIPITMSFTEPKKHKAILEKGHLSRLKDTLRFALIDNIRLRWLIVYAAIVIGFNNAGLWLYQPYFKLTGIDIAYFGIIFASFQIVAALSSRYAHKIESRLGQKNSLVMLALIVVVGYFLTSKIVFIFSFAFIYLFQFVRGFSEPVLSDYVNKLTRSEIRATVLSINNLVERIVYASIIPFIGWIADVYSITQALMITGISALAFGVVVLVILHKDRVI